MINPCLFCFRVSRYVDVPSVLKAYYFALANAEVSDLANSRLDTTLPSGEKLSLVPTVGTAFILHIDSTRHGVVVA